GKNNEGKSNILRALALAMSLMKIYCSDTRPFVNASRDYLRSQYLWSRDYPLSLQEKNPTGSSSVDFNFELDDRDIVAIRELTGIRLSGYIPVRVSTNGTTAKIDIPKRGTAAFSDVENKKKIIEYVCFKIDFNFIPAVRTETDALRVIDILIARALTRLDENPEYIEASRKIEQLRQEVLNNIANHISSPLKNYLPSLKSVHIHICNEGRRRSTKYNTEIIIDDGTPTPIQQKGDGIKSLTALAMLNIPAHSDRVSVIAIEEPESHLHPESARQLYDTIMALSETHQVVLTTHSPLFINRACLEENIIVNAGKATPVKRIKEIRDVLGIRVSDNLTNAEHVLIVEGEDDRIAMSKLLPQMSTKINTAIQNGTLIIDDMGGCGNLPYKLTFYRNLQCKYHVLLDNDDAGRHAFEAAERDGLLTLRNLTYTICNGSPNAELEDCYRKDFYESSIFEEFGVKINVSEFRSNKKWSDRIADCFRSQGKPWNDAIEKRVKFVVVSAIPQDYNATLNPYKRSSIDALVSAIETLLP
ncbi:MAG: AAA family ATPase, partial [Clostridia bacterium]|nr:AAA family ATPase [Clostridia bacterium]